MEVETEQYITPKILSVRGWNVTVYHGKTVCKKLHRYTDNHGRLRRHSQRITFYHTLCCVELKHEHDRLYIIRSSITMDDLSKMLDVIGLTDFEL